MSLKPVWNNEDAVKDPRAMQSLIEALLGTTKTCILWAHDATTRVGDRHPLEAKTIIFKLLRIFKNFHDI
jgi:hypothetical protein